MEQLKKPPFIPALKEGDSPAGMIKALRMISEENPAAGFVTCTKLFGDENRYVRLAAYHIAKSCVRKLNKEDASLALNRLVGLLGSEDSWVRRNAIESLSVLFQKEETKDVIYEHIKNLYKKEKYIYVRKRIEKLFLNGEKKESRKDA